MLRDFVRLIYPSVCIHCSLSLNSAEKYLCTSCKIDLPITHDSFLEPNEMMNKFSFNQKVKGAASYLFFYQKGVAQKLLHKLKYQGQKEIGALLGKWFSGEVAHIGSLDFIIPVPLHTSRQRSRGYNQSAEIAKGIAEQLSISVREDLVIRKKSSSSQTSKTKVERWKNIENVYGNASEEVQGKKVLVIDDVITTGATLGMLCERLEEKGVSEIYVGAIARGQ